MVPGELILQYNTAGYTEIHIQPTIHHAPYIIHIVYGQNEQGTITSFEMCRDNWFTNSSSIILLYSMIWK